MEVHNLNPTAATVWQLCDGQTAPQEMAEQLKGDLTPAQAEELVWLSMKRLEQAKLLKTKVTKPTAGRKVYTRREILAKLGVAAVMLPVVSSIVAPGPVEAQSPQPPADPQTLNYTGAAQTFAVPAGVTSVTLEVFGAQGGDSIVIPGGLGGRVIGTIAVTPGEVLQVNVGGKGGNIDVTGTPTGGFNGGGQSGVGSTNGAGGGGGGASDVRQGGTALTNRIIVAGGGGGTGNTVGYGGDGGNMIGADGSDGSTTGGGGGGGTQTAGGSAGQDFNGGTSATVGILDNGGNGGTGSSRSGGGGGGYYGGGGGGSNGTVAGGGGGGSSFTTPGATGVAHQQGVRSGNGQVIISW